jgi:outer membrane protein OmpA-like peptidoglycan-associated protein
MNSIVSGILGVVVAGALAGCAGQTEQLSMQHPTGQAPQSVTFPNGTVFGGASGREASTLAQIMVDANNNNMQEFGKIERTETKNLQTSQQALAMIERLSQQQGTGEITLFFPTGETHIRSGTMEYQRLVNFLDYLSRESRGRKVLFLLIGSASATGDRRLDERLSRERSQAPEPIIDQFLVNVPTPVLQGLRLGRHVQPQECAPDGRTALPERARHCRL